MQRLIDANALIKTYEGWIPQLMLPKDAGDKRGVETCIKVLQDAPTIDATPVIRCRECIGKSTWINDPKYGCAVCSMSGMYPKNENGYCSYAIRKDNKK